MSGQGTALLIESVALRRRAVPARPVLSLGGRRRHRRLRRLARPRGADAAARRRVSSWLGQRLGLSSHRLKILLGCGAAAGFGGGLQRADRRLAVRDGGRSSAASRSRSSGRSSSRRCSRPSLSRAAASAAPIYAAAPAMRSPAPGRSALHFGLGLVGAVAAVAFVLGVRLVARLFGRLRCRCLWRCGRSSAWRCSAALGVLRGRRCSATVSTTITAALHEELPLAGCCALLAGQARSPPRSPPAAAVRAGMFTPSLCLRRAGRRRLRRARPHALAARHRLVGAYAAVGMAAVAAGSTPRAALGDPHPLRAHRQLRPHPAADDRRDRLEHGRQAALSVLDLHRAARAARRRAVVRGWRRRRSPARGRGPGARRRRDAAPGDPTREVVERFLGTQRQRLFVVDGEGRLLGFGLAARHQAHARASRARCRRCWRTT